MKKDQKHLKKCCNLSPDRLSFFSLVKPQNIQQTMIIAKNLISREELVNVRTPDATDSFTPIAHSFLVDQTLEALDRAGYSVTEEKHALARFGQRYFGGFQIAGPDINSEERKLVLGLRNSHDRTFAASICVGNRMIVCENLCFSSDIKLARRHTTNILRDIPRVLSEAIGRLFSQWTDMETRINSYKNAEIGFDQACALSIQLAEAKALPAREVFPVTQEFKAPRHPEFNTPTLWNLYNSVTENLKGSDLTKLPARTMVMQSIFDKIAGHRSVFAEEVIDVEALAVAE